MMSSLLQACLELTEAYCNRRLQRRDFIRREARLRIEEDGSKAFETAQQVARLARHRGEEECTEIWLQVAAEIARQETAAKRRVMSSLFAKR